MSMKNGVHPRRCRMLIWVPVHSRQKAWTTISTAAPSAATVQRGALRAIRAGPSSALLVSQQSQQKRFGRMPVLRRASPVTQRAVSRPLCSPCQHQLSRRCPTLCQRPTRQQRMRVRTTLPRRWRRPLTTQRRLSTSLSTPDGVRNDLHPANEGHLPHTGSASWLCIDDSRPRACPCLLPPSCQMTTASLSMGW